MEQRRKDFKEMDFIVTIADMRPEQPAEMNEAPLVLNGFSSSTILRCYPWRWDGLQPWWYLCAPTMSAVCKTDNIYAAKGSSVAILGCNTKEEIPSIPDCCMVRTLLSSERTGNDLLLH